MGGGGVWQEGIGGNDGGCSGLTADSSHILFPNSEGIASRVEIHPQEPGKYIHQITALVSVSPVYCDMLILYNKKGICRGGDDPVANKVRTITIGPGDQTCVEIVKTTDVVFDLELRIRKEQYVEHP